MSWGAVAIAGATVVAGSMSSSAASDASAASAEASQAQLDFAMQQYDDWLAVYGPIQDNLSSYYSNLTPEYYEATGLEAIAKEQAETQEQIDASLAQRGITDSGVAASLDAQLEMDVARQNAQVRRDAPHQVMQQQQNFLAIGQGLNPSSQASSALAQEASRTAATAASAEAAAGAAWSSAIPAVGQAVTGLTEYYG